MKRYVSKKNECQKTKNCVWNWYKQHMIFHLKKNILAVLVQNFFWSNIRQNVKKFVQNYNFCERNKFLHD